MDRNLRLALLIIAAVMGLFGCKKSATDAESSKGSSSNTAAQTANRPSVQPPVGSHHAIRLTARDAVELTNSAGLPDLNRDFTIEMLLRWPAATQSMQHTVYLAGSESGKGNGDTSAPGWLLRAQMDSGKFQLQFEAATAQYPPLSLSAPPETIDDRWRSVAVSRSGNQVRIFLDGKQVAEESITADLISSSTPVYVGVAPDSPAERATYVDLLAFRLSQFGRYKEDYQSQVMWFADSHTLSLLQFRMGTGDDVARQGRDGLFYGPEWIVVDLVTRPGYQSHAASKPAKEPMNLKQALVALRHSDDERFHEILKHLGPTLPEIQVAVPGEPVKWNTLTLNQTGEGLTAVRFTSPLADAADLRWCFVIPTYVIQQWAIVGMEDEPEFQIVDEPLFATEYYVDFEDLDEPETNCAVFQYIGGGRIQPREERTAWFAFGTDKPVTISIAARLTPAVQRSWAQPSSEAVAKELGITMPLARKHPQTAEGYVSRANATGRHDAAAGAGWAERGLAKWPDDRGLHRAAIAWNQRRAMSLAHSGETLLARRYFSKSGQQAETFQTQFADLSEEDRKLVSGVLYNQGCSQALAGDAESAMASLQDAVRAGFQDVKLLQTDPDLASLRELPEFAALLESLPSGTAP
jgi:hypothetical protein